MPNKQYEIKKIAVVFLFEKDGKYLFLKRGHTGACDGFYMLPGGHVDEGETVLVAAVREIKEELGVIVDEKDLEFVLVEPSKTFVHFFFKVKKYIGVLKNNEPEKHDNIAFLSLDIEDILPIVRTEIEAIQKGITFMESNENF